jgi:hypothetical protein
MKNDGLPATEQEQARFFDQLCEGFAAASARTGEIVRDFRIAGTSVRLRFAGEALTSAIVPGLAGLLPALAAHVQCEICLWDSESTGIPLVSPPRPWRDFTERGNIWGFNSSRYRSAYLWGEGSVNVLDRETRQAVYWVPSANKLPVWVLSSPLRSILHWWMELNGRQLVHAAAVGHGRRGVLIPGRGGAGKSSTSLACLQAGMDFISDDYLALALDPEPRVYRLYSTAKLDPRSLHLFPDLQSRCRAVHRPGFDKVVLFLEDGYGQQLKESQPLELVLKPSISGLPGTTLAPVEAREIERALASETLLHLPHAGARTVEILDRVSREIPSSAIHLGTDRARIAAVIQKTIETRAESDARMRPAPDRRPFLSVITHIREENREELSGLVSMLQAQGYPRTELIVTAEGKARAMAGDVAGFPGSIRFLSFNDPVVNAEAWNRAIRESFSELLIFIDPGDRFPPGALDALADAAQRESEAAWVRGKVLSSDCRNESLYPLRGALIRKSAFRECGLFQADPLFQGREHHDWLKRVEGRGLIGRELDSVTLHAACAPPNPLPNKIDWGFLKAQLDRQRRSPLE